MSNTFAADLGALLGAKHKEIVTLVAERVANEDLGTIAQFESALTGDPNENTETLLAQLGNQIRSEIGDRDDLTTAVKSSIVAAVNELVTALAGKTATTTTGDLTALTTSVKTSIVDAINEVKAQVQLAADPAPLIDAKVGQLSELTTTEKGTVVGALNEVKAAMESLSSNTIAEGTTAVTATDANGERSVTITVGDKRKALISETVMTLGTTSAGGNGDNYTIQGSSGATANGSGGQLIIRGGKATEGNGGGLLFSAGIGASATGAAMAGGHVRLTAGAGVNGGANGGTGIGADGTLTSAGKVLIKSGTANGLTTTVGSVGGDITITAANGVRSLDQTTDVNKNGGAVIINSGNGAGTGTHGKITLNASGDLELKSTNGQVKSGGKRVATQDDVDALTVMITAATEKKMVADLTARDAVAVPANGSMIFFVQDDGDGKWAMYHATADAQAVVSYVKIADPDLFATTMSDGAVLAALLNNADTNVVTDAELAKLIALPTAVDLQDSLDDKATVAEVTAVDGKIGALSGLTTTEKSTVVGAINEVKAALAATSSDAITSGDTSVKATDAGASGSDVTITTDGVAQVRVDNSAITLKPNLSATAHGSAVTLAGSSGGTTSGNGGQLTVRGGAATDGSGGTLSLLAGAAGGPTRRNGGRLMLRSTAGTVDGNNGGIDINAGGSLTSDGLTGGVAITTGTKTARTATVGSDGGSIRIVTSSAVTSSDNTTDLNRNGGNITISTGPGVGTGAHGNINLTAAGDLNLVATNGQVKSGGKRVATQDDIDVLSALAAAATEKVVVANIAARDALVIGGGGSKLAFVSDDGDGKWALYHGIANGSGVVTWVKISDPDLLNAVMSNAQIKAALLANADTHVLSDVEYAKVGTIGDVTALTTTAKGTLVDAINEVKAALSGSAPTKISQGDSKVEVLDSGNASSVVTTVDSTQVIEVSAGMVTLGSANGGSVTLTAKGTTAGTANSLAVAAGSRIGGDGGALSLKGGNSDVGVGGGLTVKTGDSAPGQANAGIGIGNVAAPTDGGIAIVASAKAVPPRNGSVDGGSLALKGGDAVGTAVQVGGNVTIAGGTGSAGGADGSVAISGSTVSLTRGTNNITLSTDAAITIGGTVAMRVDGTGATLGNPGNTTATTLKAAATTTGAGKELALKGGASTNGVGGAVTISSGASATGQANRGIAIGAPSYGTSAGAVVITAYPTTAVAPGGGCNGGVLRLSGGDAEIGVNPQNGGDVIISGGMGTSNDLAGAVSVNASALKINAETQFNAPALASVGDVGFASSLVLNFAQYQDFVIGDLTGPLTIANPTVAPKKGASGHIWLKQNSTGNFAVSMGSMWKKMGSGSINLAAGKETVIGYSVRTNGTIHYWILGEA